MFRVSVLSVKVVEFDGNNTVNVAEWIIIHNRNPREIPLEEAMSREHYCIKFDTKAAS